MTAFLKIDECQRCRRSLPWEWVPAVLLNGKPLAGTGVWQSQLVAGRCAACIAALEEEGRERHRIAALEQRLVQLLGGPKPYREFTLERFEIAPGTQAAVDRCKHFSPSAESLYLWGPCGVGKTHLAYAIIRRCFEETLSVEILRCGQLSRKARMKDPEQEQAVVDQFVNAEVCLFDDLGAGSDTAFSRQILQEIFDARDFNDRAGMVITSKYSLDDLAAKFGDDSIPSRLAGMCQVVEIKGPDYRLRRCGAAQHLNTPGGAA